MTSTIRIIRPSSQEKINLLPARIAELETLGFQVLHEDLEPDPHWPYTSSSIQHRSEALVHALLEDKSNIIMAGRGGYGASDLLAHLPWEKLSGIKPKWICGFSDISALHSAFFAKLKWPGLHAPMPATNLWGKDDDRSDLEILIDLLKGKTRGATISIRPISPHLEETIEGWLFGGCFSVLTNLIGTPYFPSSLDGAIVFFEDIGEHPARLMRYWNQWILSGALKGVKAVVLGNFIQCAPSVPDNSSLFLHQFAKRTGLPTFHSYDFGHVSPNIPLVVGARGLIQHQALQWSMNEKIA